ncbi:MAG: extracellular solute-binding protein [Acidimicrobiia bacterium]|nr:extracellular solute-binding protein [bacterium]MXW58497.1 extracellular solute-binding protein [Acidimicrobiia bacterium]MXZ87108.1 extracellular solute-binding protein [Acidimicrobiia bacterium]MYB73547.1 extracellular solute-binding protein [Acidimicrobiia bacterium]MYG72165.1 extracellular solute-binding protein [Acidimicrobiia bacterium]
MIKISRNGLAGALLAVALLAAACGGDSGTKLEGVAATVYDGKCADDNGTSVTVYSGRSENLMKPVFDAFACESGTSVRVRWGSSTDLALLIDTEGDRTEADVFISRSPGPVGFLEANGHLTAMDSSVLGLVDGDHRGDNGTWIGFSGRKRVLVHNLDSVPPSELPTSVFDLTESEWRGRVAIPATNGSFVDWFTVFRDQYGNEVASEWLSDMVDNDARYYPNNVAIVEAAARGEIDVGLVNHYYNYRLAADAEAAGEQHRAANYDLSDEDIGSLLIITAATMTKNVEDREAAQSFIAYLLSPSAQRFFTRNTFEYPLAGGVEPNPVLPPLAALSIGSVDFDALGGGFEATEDIIQRSGILSQ